MRKAAGVLIVSEAGGKITDLYGWPFDLASASMVSTDGRIYFPVLEILEARK